LVSVRLTPTFVESIAASIAQIASPRLMTKKGGVNAPFYTPKIEKVTEVKGNLMGLIDRT
jgi:hypothetical protein